MNEKVQKKNNAGISPVSSSIPKGKKQYSSLKLCDRENTHTPNMNKSSERKNKSWKLRTLVTTSCLIFTVSKLFTFAYSFPVFFLAHLFSLIWFIMYVFNWLSSVASYAIMSFFDDVVVVVGWAWDMFAWLGSILSGPFVLIPPTPFFTVLV